MEVTTEHPKNRCRDCALGSHGFMRALGGRGQQRLDRARTEKTCRRGTQLYQQGEPAENVYCIGSSVVKFSRRSPIGRETTVGIAGPGRMVGLGAISRGGDYGCSATIVRTGTICVISRETIEEIQKDHPPFARALQAELAKELDRAEERISLLACPRLEPKLAALLLELEGPETPCGPALEDFSRRELAQLCGVSAEALARCLKRWKAEGIIDPSPGTIRVRDRNQLEDLRRQL